jgi:hypothetical protein
VTLGRPLFFLAGWCYTLIFSEATSQVHVRRVYWASSSEDNSFSMSVLPGPSQANASGFIEVAPALFVGTRSLYDGREMAQIMANWRFDLGQS